MVEVRLRQGVQGGGGLVQDQKGRVLVEGPGEAQPLSLPAGEVHAVLLHLLGEAGVQSLGEGVDGLPQSGTVQGLPDLLPVKLLPARHVLADGEGQEAHVLEHRAHQPEILLLVEVPHRHTIHQNLPALRLVEAGEELHQRGLPRAVETHQGDLLPRLQGEGQVVNGRRLRLRVGEGHVPELHPGRAADGGGFCAVSAGGRAVLLHEDAVIVEADIPIEGVVRDLGKLLQQSGQGRKDAQGKGEPRRVGPPREKG